MVNPPTIFTAEAKAQRSDTEMIDKDRVDRQRRRRNCSHTEISSLSLHDALPIYTNRSHRKLNGKSPHHLHRRSQGSAKRHRDDRQRPCRSAEETSELQSHRDLLSFPTRRSSDLYQ